MIAIVYPQFFGVQGIARYVDSFLANLPEGHPPVLLVTGDEEQRQIDYPGVRIHAIPYRESRTSLFSWGRTVRRFLREEFAAGRIKVVNFHWPPLIQGLFLPPEIPTVLTAHTTYIGMSGKYYDQRYYVPEWSDLSVAVKRWMERRILRHTDSIVALTEQGRGEVLTYGFQGPIEVIPNGADTAKFRPDTSVAKDFDVLFSGRIETRKGSRTIANFCRGLLARKPDARIAIVGYGVDDAHVAQAVADMAPNVVMTGKVPFSEMKAYYERSKIYVSTSYYEGLPGTCLEALSMKLPAVVWDFDFYRGLVENGKTGFRVPPNHHEAMVEKAMTLLADDALRERLGEASRQLLQDSYCWKNLAPLVLDVIVKAAGKSAVAGAGR
ncbi:MAG: glycosyltransferase family 4 protein [Fibrobacterota bacterium]|nr:glycosyltransferase family 4 protein [Fibrobacterota bacterium]QQS03794.1 MAG: glycosyltransferase family 4 protein [Fibrobacterota bacterium]